MDSDLPAGTYIVNASKPGCLPQAEAGISVTPGSTTYANFLLQPE